MIEFLATYYIPIGYIGMYLTGIFQGMTIGEFLEDRRWQKHYDYMHGDEE